MTDLDPILTLLTEIRDALLRMERNNDTLAHKRRLKAARQARYRAKASRQSLSADHSPCLGGALAADSMRSVFVDAVDATKETKSEKRDIPPTPPIERKGKSKEKEEEVVVPRTREERIRQVSAYNAELKGNVDAAYFVDYYAGKGTWPADWRAAFRVWLGNDRSDGRTTSKRNARAKYRGPRPDGYHDASEDEKKAILEGFV